MQTKLALTGDLNFLGVEDPGREADAVARIRRLSGVFGIKLQASDEVVVLGEWS